LSAPDALFNGKLTVRQEKEGYRFSVDAVLLAALTEIQPHTRVMDLGTGCGIVPLIMAYRNNECEFVGLEIQPELVGLAERNIEMNGFLGRIRIMQMDFRKLADRFPTQTIDLVTSNPPYYSVHSGRINPNSQKAIARHELTASAKDVFTAAQHLLHRNGRLAVIYPASRLDHLFLTAADHGFHPRKLTIVYSTPSKPARLAHLECQKGGGREMQISPPFFIHQENGDFSEEMRKIYELAS
jgi:tRNA1Val (adenine37-N6)-methyltransferase